MKKTFKLVMKKNVEGNEWVVRVYINGKYDEGKTYYGDDNKEDAEASMLDMRRKLKKDGYEEEIKEGDNMKSTFKTIKEEVIEERKIIDGIKKGVKGVVDVLDAALVPRGLAGGKKCACRGEGWVNCECSKSNRKKKKEEIKEIEERKIIDGIKKGVRGVVDVLDAALVPRGLAGGGKKCECKECKGKDCKNCECKDCECAGCEGRIKKEELEEIKTLVDQILEEGGDVFKKHQMKIAKDTLKMSDAGAKVAGGMWWRNI